MARMQLVTALDFAARKPAKGEDGYGRYTYRRGDNWYLVSFGPKYSNTYQITEATEAEWAKIQSLERAEETLMKTLTEPIPAQAEQQGRRSPS